MQVASRNKRQREFLLWFEAKYGLEPHADLGTGVERVIATTALLRSLISTHRPLCYWCREAIEPDAIKHLADNVTLHHIDEDRDHNTVSNLDICHKTCHQRMHKAADMADTPTATLWALMAGGPVAESVNPDFEIPGIGRG